MIAILVSNTNGFEIEIETGAIYNGPQLVKARLMHADHVGTDIEPEMRLVFDLIDESRHMHEKVAVMTPWTTHKEYAAHAWTIAHGIMQEYLASRYVYEY